MTKYDIIYADPPWDYKGQTQHNGKGGLSTGGALIHYSTMVLAELKKMNVSAVAKEDCLLFMWATSPHLDQAIELLKAWGFQWSTVGFVWDKQKVNPGFYTMSQCELCLIGKKGKIPKPRGSRKERQLVSELRSEHSVKPKEVRSRIERMFPDQKKLELFAREVTLGWDVFGNEVQSDICLK